MKKKEEKGFFDFIDIDGMLKTTGELTEAEPIKW